MARSRSLLLMFPRKKDFEKFLKTSGQTVAVIKLRVRLDLLQSRSSRAVSPGRKGALSVSAIEDEEARPATVR